MSSLTQEVSSLRAQNTYMESKLRSVEAVAESAGKAADELRKRNDQIQAENVRLKAENQQLKGENDQLVQFKAILMSTATNLQQPTMHSGLLSSTLRPQQFGVPDPMLSPARSSASLSTHDLDGYKPATTTAHGAPMTSSSIQNPSFFFSPLKRPPHHQHQQQQESISITNHASTSHPHATPSFAHHTQQQHQRASPGARSYAHVMPSPLAPDALMSPQPGSASQATKSSDNILHQINANLSASGGGRARPSHSPVRGSAAAASSSSAYASSYQPSPYSSTAASSSFSGAPSGHLVDQARQLFHLAQARLLPSAFSEFVGLVQQFRTTSSHAADHTWEEIRLKAAMLLAGHHDVLGLFDQLLQATQLQQRQ